MTPPRPTGLTGAERLRRGAKALFILEAIVVYAAGFATGCLAMQAWCR